MQIGLFFGSFNPIHIGHLAIANYLAENTDLNQIWFVVSPHNPLKEKNTLLADHHRLRLVDEAIADYDKFKSSSIEFDLPQPSYTVNTMEYLKEKYPTHTFSLIMGSDNLQTLNKWKNFTALLNNYKIYVYPRPGFDGGEFKNHPSVVLTHAPVMEISSTFIRAALKEKKDIRFMLPPGVYNYIKEMHFYEK